MLNKLAKQIVAWRIKKGFETGWDNMPEKLMLIVTEVSEAMEAYRMIGKLPPSDPEPHNKSARDFRRDYYGTISIKKYKNFKEELADAIIRILDITGTMGIDIEAEIKSKMKINNMRPVRHGKQY